MKYLFLLTITPVQSFISQARKTRDLWAGSRMLSDLMKAVFNKIREKGGDIIFPLKPSESMPNRILAKFTFNYEVNLKELGAEITQEVDNQVLILTRKALELLKKQTNEVNHIQEAFSQQIQQYFSTFWAWAEIEDDCYAEAFDNVNNMLGAVKNTRSFRQYPEIGRKCALTGEQNALIFQGKKPQFADITQPHTNEFLHRSVSISNELMEEGEGLSAIGYIKRFYPLSGNLKKTFESTADIALLKTLEDLKAVQENSEKNNPQTGSELFLEAFARSLNERSIEDVDGQLFYQENLTRKYFLKNNLNLSLLREAKAKLNKLYKIARGNNIPFVKYYSVLLFDADNMGAWLSGKYLNIPIEKLENYHRHLSGLLTNFAGYAKSYVDGSPNEPQKGKTVYAGGDDYLGFVNLYYLFEVLKHLRHQFKKLVNDELAQFDGFHSANSNEMTFSAGIAIAHYKIPLSEVLHWAREMEKDAKKSVNKNSFGIAVLKHSGDIQKMVLPFHTVVDDSIIWYPDLMNSLVNELKNHFSSTFIKVLNEEVELLGAEKCDKELNDIIQHEIERTIRRSRKVKDLPTSVVENMIKTVQLLYQSNCGNLNNFLGTIAIADVISRKLQGNE